MARSSKPRTAIPPVLQPLERIPASQRLVRLVAVHAAADSLLRTGRGPRACWPTNAGAGDTTSARSRCPTAATPSSSARRARAKVYVSKSLDGPWEHLGTVRLRASPLARLERLAPGPSRRQLHVHATRRQIFFSDKGVLGPYKRDEQLGLTRRESRTSKTRASGTPAAFTTSSVNSWSTRKAYHLTFPRGFHDWTNRGVAYDPREPMVRYTGGAVNH